MGVFWGYFKDTLRFPLIWADGPLAALVRGAAGALDACREDVAAMRTSSLPDRCEDVYLRRISDGRGLSRWESEDDALWRFRTETAFHLHMTSGRRSSIEEMFLLVGINARIVEPGDAARDWAAAGGMVLDGTWVVGVHALDGLHDLDGTWLVGGADAVIQPMGAVVGMLALDWAEFGVVMDLGDASKWDTLARRIVYEFKPARSMPVWGYALGMEFGTDVAVGLSMAMTKEFDVSQSFSATMDLAMSQVGEAPEDYLYARVGESLLRLDNGWVLGKNPMMIMAQGTSYKDFKVDGTWMVSDGNGLALADKVITVIA
ncbi:hypothetical protein DO021_19690 [Desulfobacter hydrogenophilus]|uniref:Uncharacterized protein n=1 Tax=Desulfobacter hydrogenophilus TaxID=2291 RepID=A0A328F7I7_9BACT|nr:phage tail protein [Desulfobacter hydrogenophilus]NDY73992.1 hypothetical protein [Desulfobacter hydrogenophilus]QBH14337.1 hypothetical protein EYB58_16290 [Desulfobacter hydrogenophilus]RAM00339.1 hypothetical protein DO021_19690 [Desulfobacter hydrogenophilus]